jgi:putative membrane protein
MRHTFLTAIAAAALTLAPAAGRAQTPDPSSQQKPPAKGMKDTSTAHEKQGAVSAADRAFVNAAAIGDLAEVDLGNLAKEKGSSQDVKNFGDRMVTDHGKANDQLKSWAQQKNVTLPTELDARHKATHDRLAKLSGEAFDKAYMRDMLTDHKADVAKFKKESASAHDPGLKSWAGQTLPTLEDHLKVAQDTASKVGVTAATSGHRGAKKHSRHVRSK